MTSNLRRRWTAAQRKQINKDFNRRARRFLDELPRVVRNGVEYIDLRGFPFECHITIDLYRVDFSDCDFSMGTVQYIAATECIFRGAELCDNALPSDARRCDFSGAKMHRVSFDGKYRECSFVGADLTGCTCVRRTRFVRCDFSRATLARAELNDAVFDNCRWRGATFGGMGFFVGSKFIGTQPTAKQLGDATLEDPVEEQIQREVERELALERKAKKRKRR